MRSIDWSKSLVTKKEGLPAKLLAKIPREHGHIVLVEDADYPRVYFVRADGTSVKWSNDAITNVDEDKLFPIVVNKAVCEELAEGTIVGGVCAVTKVWG
jgi:hypothetical protein